MSDTPDETASVSERYRRAAAWFTERVEGTPAERWDDPSPCAGWTARDVVRNVVDSHLMFRRFGREEMPEAPDIGDVGDDPVGVWGRARDLVQGDLDDPAIAGIEFDGFFGRTTVAGAIDRFLVFDLHVHGWDLARATGQPERMDPAVVRRLHDAAIAFGDSLRQPGVFGPEVEAPAGADDQARFLAFIGRRP